MRLQESGERGVEIARTETLEVERDIAVAGGAHGIDDVLPGGDQPWQLVELDLDAGGGEDHAVARQLVAADDQPRRGGERVTALGPAGGTRVVGPPGIVLVGEGNPNRLKTLLANERRKHERVASETPIYEIVVGNEEGQVPLSKLQQRIMKLPRNIGPAQIDSLENRLAALANRNSAMPKGPIPQGARMRNVQRAVRRAR